MHRTGGPSELRLADVPDPAPGPGEALVRLAAIGVNFIEIYQRIGIYPVPFPFTPGTEGAGVVVAVGDGVDAALVGRQVASESFRGAYAELAVAPAARLVQLPAAIDAASGAAAMIQALTAHYLTHTTWPLAHGEWCLIHAAAGGTGLLMCQMARQRGARVIATVGTATKAEPARAAGAELVILHGEEDVPAVVRQVTGGAGVRVAYDSVGRTTWQGSLASLGPRGMLVLFGQSSGVVPPIDPLVLSRGGSLFLTRPTLGHYVQAPGELQERAQSVLSMLDARTLRLTLGPRFSLANAAAAHEALGGRGTIGKLLLEP